MSKVKQHIREQSNPKVDPDKTINHREYTFQLDGDGNQILDLRTKTKVIWKNIDKEKRALHKVKPINAIKVNDNQYLTQQAS